MGALAGENEEGSTEDILAHWRVQSRRRRLVALQSHTASIRQAEREEGIRQPCSTPGQYSHVGIQATHGTGKRV